jgi:uncharacterized protein YutE (UPF0331/DUF86 family)
MSPGELDRAVVRRHLLALDEALTRLRSHRTLTLGELRADHDRLWAVERGLQLCAQNALDVATHVAAGSGRDVSDYASAIDRLRDLGVLPPDFAARFRGIAGFRNVLVHGYLGIDLAIVHRLLQQGLDDFATFSELVTRFVERA